MTPVKERKPSGSPGKAKADPGPPQKFLRDSGGLARAVPWHLPDGGTRERVKGFPDWTRARCRSRTATEEWGDKKASLKFRFGRRQPLSGIRAGPAREARSACREAAACPAPCNRLPSGRGPIRSDRSLAIAHPSRPA